MRYWPEQFAPEFSVGELGYSEEARTALAEWKEDLYANRFASVQPPTDADVALARRKLLRVHNPVGWMLADSLMCVDVRQSAAEYRTALEETKNLLTERIKSRS